MAEHTLKPSFEEEFPEQSGMTEQSAHMYELGLINAAQARGETFAHPIAEPVAEQIPLQGSSQVNRQPRMHARKYGSFVLKKDGTPDLRFMSPAEKRAADRLPEDQWNIR